MTESPTYTWRFEQVDSWFFREARPYGTIGGVELSGVFPPPARAVAGAIRTMIGEHHGVDWREFAKDGDHRWGSLREQIGTGHGQQEFGRFRMKGPYLEYRGKRLFPAPLVLLGKGEGPKRRLTRLRPGDACVCDLSGQGDAKERPRVRLPAMAQALHGANPLSDWLTPEGFAAVLAGGLPAVKDCVPTGKLFTEDPRLGIAREYARRTASEGLLYQTRHVRLYDGVSIRADVSGIASGFTPSAGSIRFGGDGRFSHVTVSKGNTDGAFVGAPSPPDPNDRRLLLILTTQADFGERGWLPPGFDPQVVEEGGAKLRCWKGTIADIPLIIECACIGKTIREGGWDAARRRPREVRSTVPAGSTYFCRLDEQAPPVTDAIKALHGATVKGLATEIGYGELAVGLWNEVC